MWNPGVYNKFKAERFAPFYDLVKLVVINPNLRVIDLGCGTGELTRKLADSLPGCNVLGVDSSPEMLQESQAFANDQVKFERRSMEEVVQGKEKWDLVFSNAAIQWVLSHDKFLPRLIGTVREGGQLTVQMPSNHDHFSHVALRTLSSREPYRTAMHGWTRTSPVLSIEAYARILFENGGKDVTVFEKVYPHVMKDADAVYEWMRGTAILPYVEKVPQELREGFIEEYKAMLRNEYPETPVFYPFKRTLLSATF